MKFLLFLLLISSIVHAQTKTLSLGGGVGYNQCFYLHHSEEGKITNTEFSWNYNAYFYSENLFYAGLQIVNQLKGIRVFYDGLDDKKQYDFTIYENRIGLISGMKITEKICPYLGLNLSKYRNGFFDYFNVGDKNYLVPDNYFSKYNPSFELGCNFITGDFNTKKVSLINKFAFRFTPMSMFKLDNKVEYKNIYGETISTPFYNKMIDVSYSISIQYNKHFH